jgi:GTP pyrophosphokinase
LAWYADFKENKITNYQLHVLTSYVYVFTPKGDTIQMPVGSTALDFAYRIHTDIGDHCYGIKINNKMAKIDSILNTGDLVEILINKKINVNKNWLSIVKTAWAKEHIRKQTQNISF